MYGMNVFELIAPEERERATQNVQEVLEKGYITNIEYMMLRKDGSRFPAELNAALLRDTDGAPATFMGITRDITERKRVMQAERRLIQLKEEFMASVSHDLRTPLFSLIGYIDLLRDGKVNDVGVQGEFLARASEDADRLMDMVNELLDITRLETNSLALSIEQVELGEVIKEVVQSLRERANAKRISLQSSIRQPALLADVDRLRMRRVLINLVENAIKFTYEGGDVMVTGELQDESVTIQVVDNGCGIPLDDCSKVFDKFFQVSSPRSTNKTGTGLGLYISRQVVEAHGGSITVSSQVGIGSTFTIVIPVKKRM